MNSMNYGENIKNMRERIGISQTEMSKMLEIDKSLYGRYEKEKQTIPIKHLITLCNYFNVSLDFIFSFTSIQEYKNIKKKANNIKAGKNLKEWRKSLKLTQLELANYLNTTQSVIADYERGRYLISTPFLYTICKKYNISADYLLGRIDEPISF